MQEVRGHLSGAGKKFAIIVTRFNEFISSKLLDGACDCLVRHGVKEQDITVYWVPGSFEIPGAALRVRQLKYDCILCLGAVIRGDTPHFDYIANEVTKGIAALNLEKGVPLIYGMVTADTVDQAIDRAGTKMGNKGWDAAMTGIELVDLYSKIK